MLPVMTDECLPSATSPCADNAVRPAGRRWVVPAVGLAGLALGAGGVGLVWGLSSSPAGPKLMSTASASAPTTFTLSGTMKLIGSGNIRTAGGRGCAGSGGFDDIAAGAGVTVYDGGSQIVAKGQLANGALVDGVCRFMVIIEQVPAGPAFYQVEVSHRGKLTLTAADAKAGKFAGVLSSAEQPAARSTVRIGVAWRVSVLELAGQRGSMW